MSPTLYQQAIKAHREGRHQEAIKLFKESLQENSDDAKGHYNLGNVYADIDDYSAAVDSYLASLKIDNSVASVWYNLGNMYLEMDQYEEAIDAFDHAIALKNSYIEAWFNKGVAQTELDVLDKAKESYSKTVALDQNFHYGWYNLACMFATESDLRQTLYCLQQAITYSGQDIDYREMAQSDEYFTSIRNHPEFIQLIEG